MKHLLLIALAAGLAGGVGHAQAPVNGSVATVGAGDESATAGTAAATDVKPNAMISTADGRRLGRVDHVRSANASVIFAGHFVNVPVATLTASKGGYVTSLKLAEVVKR